MRQNATVETGKQCVNVSFETESNVSKSLLNRKAMFQLKAHHLGPPYLQVGPWGRHVGARLRLGYNLITLCRGEVDTRRGDSSAAVYR